ncbi:glutathione transferase GstA [Shewanella surugensis]|uniref:Glutathione transferase GstA n=1 Tax=Shewanella surugensis TaxID=212020 RepID=A0ABT0LI02_9GAMM|nr:glutathione transferase GstA [Shewanella surugensis]MCL1127336.1 glutathione transferase GstA [Shewanella surugensis]
MKLYYSPGACSLAPHIILCELGIEVELVKVDFHTKVTEHGNDFYQISTQGCVPALQIEPGEVLTESVAILQYIADQHPQAGLAPQNATLARARLQEVLNMLTSDLHKAFGPLFSPSSDSEKQQAVAVIEAKLGFINHMLNTRSYVIGDNFSIADAYLFVLLSWAIPTGIDLNQWHNLAVFFGRIAERASVHQAMQAEGLI